MLLEVVGFIVKRMWKRVKKISNKNDTEFNKDFIIYDYNGDIIVKNIENDKKIRVENLPKIIIEQYMAHVNLLKFTLNATSGIGIFLCIFFYNQNSFHFAATSFIVTICSFLGLWLVCTYCRNVDKVIEEYLNEKMSYNCLIENIFLYSKRIFNAAFFGALPFILNILFFIGFFISKTLYTDNILQLVIL